MAVFYQLNQQQSSLFFNSKTREITRHDQPITNALSNKLYLCRSTHTSSLLDYRGKVLIKADYKYIGQLSENCFRLVNQQSQEFLYLLKEKKKFGPYSNVSRYDYNHLLVAKKSDQSKDLFSLAGKPLAQDCRDVKTDSGMTICSYRDKFLLIDSNGLRAQQFQAIGGKKKFYEGLLAVKKGEHWGYITPEGKLAIPCQFTEAKRFKADRAVVKDAKAYGLINSKGKFILPCRFRNLFAAKENLYYSNTRNAHWQMRDKNGKILKKLFLENFNNKFAIRNEKGKLLLPPHGIRLHFDNDLLLVGLGPYKVYNLQKEALQHNETFFLMTPTLDREGYLVGYKGDGLYLYDPQGKKITTEPMKGYSIENRLLFKHDLFQYKVNDGSKLINRQGKEIARAYDRYTFYDYGFSGTIVCYKDREEGLIDSRGRLIIPCKYRSISREDGTELFKAWGKFNNKNRTTLYNSQGLILCEKLSSLSRNLPQWGRLTITNSEGKKGIVSASGQILIPCEFDQVDSYFTGEMTATKKGQVRIYNLMGKVTAKYDCDELKILNKDFIAIKQGDELTVKNRKSGKVLLFLPKGFHLSAQRPPLLCEHLWHITSLRL